MALSSGREEPANADDAYAPYPYRKLSEMYLSELRNSMRWYHAPFSMSDSIDRLKAVVKRHRIYETAYSWSLEGLRSVLRHLLDEPVRREQTMEELRGILIRRLETAERDGDRVWYRISSVDDSWIPVIRLDIRTVFEQLGEEFGNPSLEEEYSARNRLWEQRQNGRPAQQHRGEPLSAPARADQDERPPVPRTPEEIKLWQDILDMTNRRLCAELIWSKVVPKDYPITDAPHTMRTMKALYEARRRIMRDDWYGGAEPPMN